MGVGMRMKIHEFSFQETDKRKIRNISIYSFVKSLDKVFH